MKNFFGLLSVMLFLTVVFAGCGGGGGAPGVVSTRITVTGDAQEPAGAGARAAGRAAAAMTGLQNVADGTAVSAYYIDDDGNLTGDALATTTTSGGSFSLSLPATVTSITSSMVVVVGSGDDRMRAFISSTTDLQVDPVSEFVVSEIIDMDYSLSYYSTTELAGIYDGIVSDVEDIGFGFASFGSDSALRRGKATRRIQ